MKGKPIPYTEEMELFLKNNVKGTHFKDLTEMFNKHFRVEYGKNAVAAKCQRMGCGNGIDARIKKGNIPFNKGKKMSEELYKKCAPTMFKKGNKPHNWRPTGSRRIQARDGYVQIKVGEPKKWELEHILVWEHYHGAIDTRKECIIHLDGNRQNNDISNLKLIPRSYNAGMSFFGFWSKDKELNLTALNTVKLYKETKRKKNELLHR